MRDKKFYIFIGCTILLIFLLLIGQVLSLFDYNLAVSLGLQESEDEIGRIGIAFAKGFAFGDTIVYLPMLVIGMVGILRKIKWAIFIMLGALGISIYWPIVHLYAIFIEREFIVLQPDKYFTYPITLSLIVLYGIYGLWYVFCNFKQFAGNSN